VPGNTSYPGSLDTTTNLPIASALVTVELDGDGNANKIHSNLHGVVSEALVQVETKIGTGASTPIASRVLRGTGTGTSAWAQAVLTTDVTGTLPVANGGTGATSLSNLITLTTHTTGNYMTALSAGALVDVTHTPAEGSTATVNVDLTEAAEAAIANGDYILFLDGGATGTHAKEAVHDLATLFAGANLTATNSVIAVDDSFLKNDANDVTTGTVTSAGFVLADAANVSISVPLLANADHTTSGITAEMLAGGAISAFDLVCVHTTTQEVLEADASAYATARVIGIAPAAISDTATGTILLQGFIRDDTWTWTTGSTLYLSETAGAMTHTAPTTDGAFVQVVGVALSPDVVYFNPSMDVIEHA